MAMTLDVDMCMAGLEGVHQAALATPVNAPVDLLLLKRTTSDVVRSTSDCLFEVNSEILYEYLSKRSEV